MPGRQRPQFGQETQVGRRGPAVGPQRDRDPQGKHLFQRAARMVEPGVRPRAIDDRHPRGTLGQKGQFLVVQVVAVDHQCPGARRARGGSPSGRVPGRTAPGCQAPGPPTIGAGAAAGLRRTRFLPPRFGQMKRHRHLRGGRHRHHAAEQIGMDAGSRMGLSPAHQGEKYFHFRRSVPLLACPAVLRTRLDKPTVAPSPLARHRCCRASFSAGATRAAVGPINS